MQRLLPQEILRGSYSFQVAPGRKNRISGAEMLQTHLHTRDSTIQHDRLSSIRNRGGKKT